MKKICLSFATVPRITKVAGPSLPSTTAAQLGLTEEDINAEIKAMRAEKLSFLCLVFELQGP